MTWETLFQRAGAAAWGRCPLSAAGLTEAQAQRVETLCPGARGVFTAAFPYLAEDVAGNLSRYARGTDYHLAVVDRLESVCRGLEALWPDHRFVAGADNSPLPEVKCAWLSGVGMLGRNGLLMVPPYGSWVFLGTILTTLPLPEAGAAGDKCPDCGACIAACPGGALGRGGVDLERCLSELTQRKGELTAEQEALVRRHPLVWGCDICQQVCPCNRGAAETPLPEFRTDLLSSLTLEQVEGLTNRALKERFPRRAFTWRGPKPLARNLRWKEEG